MFAIPVIKDHVLDILTATLRSKPYIEGAFEELSPLNQGLSK